MKVWMQEDGSRERSESLPRGLCMPKWRREKEKKIEVRYAAAPALKKLELRSVHHGGSRGRSEIRRSSPEALRRRPDLASATRASSLP